MTPTKRGTAYVAMRSDDIAIIKVIPGEPNVVFTVPRDMFRSEVQGAVDQILGSSERCVYVCPQPEVSCLEVAKELAASAARS